MTSESPYFKSPQQIDLLRECVLSVVNEGMRNTGSSSQKDNSLATFKAFFKKDKQEESPNQDVDDTDLNVMTINNPPKNQYRFISGCIWQLVLGMSDGIVGGILPSIEKYYSVNYTIVSLIWMGNALGFITIAFTGHHIDNKLGLQRMPLLSTLIFITAFSIISSGVKHFPLIVASYYLSGVGGALGVAQLNIFLTKMKNSSKYLGIFHGMYGIGAFAAPLLGTLMTSQLGYQSWHYFYLVPLGLSLINLVNLAISFNGAEADLEQWYRADESESTQQSGSNKLTTKDFVCTLKNLRTWLASSFIFFYQGSEVALGGWVVTFLLDYRNSNSDSTGYVASGFWGGVTLGRFVLTHFLAKNFGVRRSILIIVTLLMGFDLIVWLVPNTIAAATFTSIMGFLIGPIYPMMISIVSEVLPRKIRFCGLLIATAFGSSGGSVIPFIVGVSSEQVGTFILHPVFIASYVFMGISFLLLPNIERKDAIRTLWQRIW